MNIYGYTLVRHPVDGTSEDIDCTPPQDWHFACAVAERLRMARHRLIFHLSRDCESCYDGSLSVSYFFGSQFSLEYRGVSRLYIAFRRLNMLTFH
jgi:hypothetical protein